MTDQEFNRIKAFMKDKYGIDMKEKRVIVSGRLENYLRVRGYKSYSQYMDAVEADVTGNLEKKLVDLLTTNHTYFMRETDHFDYLKKQILPWLKERESESKDLHIWCAASSTGEEAYTLAMIVMDFFAFEHKQWDTQLLATDVSTEVLKKAQTGIYTAEQLEPLSDNWKRRFFHMIPGTDTYEVTEELKKEVMFRQFNLMDPFPFKKKMHVIFLRNVLIYFDDNTKNMVLKKMYDVLEPGGYLFLGQTETLDRSVVPFKLVQPSVFRK